MINSSKFLG